MTQTIVFVALVMAAGFTAAFFVHVYRRKRQPYLGLWAGAWAALAVHYLEPVLQSWVGYRPWLVAIRSALLGIAAVLFFLAARQYAQMASWTRAGVAGVGLLAVWSAANGWGWVAAPAELGAGLLFFLTAWIFVRESRKQDAVTDRMLALAFVFWGLLLLAGVFRPRLTGLIRLDLFLQPFFTQMLSVALVIPQTVVAILMVMALYEEEKRRVERNMLALSSLNLATSGFVGGEIQRMLAQALDRMLSVVRIPSGALILHHGDPHGPTSVVANGLSEQFCRATQEESLDDHLVQLVARLGGLVVFRDLARDGCWARLEREDGFRKFRALALNDGLQTVVGITLQAKERVFGVLLLGSPDSRRFTPAELRLLLALGHQIGMAVENSYLVQQTSRRSEELHILNEIGRALSSTLNADELFEKILTEMRRLFDVSNFYIAFLDPRHNQVEFKMEVADGVRLPPRSRPVGNHLTEYIIRNRQPLLIRERFQEEVRKLGVVPLQQTGCYCGVPLVIYDRAVGVMGVHSLQERTFDQGHLELMLVLAGEAAIALENARLFAEEHRKSRHLALLNNVSRHAITTLNPDEMLVKITEEMERGLTYNHLGIGVLDYEAKEIVVMAEGGKRREALGRRIALGQGLVGHAARSGQQVILTGAAKEKNPALRPLLQDAVSAMALPIIYAEQVLGVFYVEHTQPREFTDEDILLLRTLADVVAGALHNATVFQKAQEQAITDGLTGVKTHRFFMEALSAEWKRSTRAGRPFSLVLMDLDRFKFVNDFYGHLDGDLVLKRVGNILEQNCRRSDVVSRYGGDEFVILMPETNIEQARQLANKLRACVASDPLLREKNITASFGTASFPIHGSTPQELIQVADASMYLSKHQGGNAVSTADHCDPSETRKWKRDVLEAYLGVTLKRQFATGPEAFEEIHRRLQQFSQSLPQDEAPTETGPFGLPLTVAETLTSLAYAVDAKDHYSQGHSQKVAALAVQIAAGLGLSEAQVEETRLAGILHDVGKVGVPEAVLNKAGPLNASEWEQIKAHAELGARLLDPLPGVATLQQSIRHHHEFYDGSGYPDGLAGDRIPLGARIIAIADAYDTIISDRAYKKGRSIEDAVAELERCSGIQFDPELVRIFVAALRQHPVSQTTESAGSSASGADGACGASEETSIAGPGEPATASPASVQRSLD